MNKSQQTKLKKEEIQQLLDSQLALTNNDPQEIRNVITNSINQAIDNVNTVTQRLLDENILIHKVITEQQKSIERLNSNKTRNNVFMTGTPTTLFTDIGTLESTMDIIDHVIKYVSLDIQKLKEENLNGRYKYKLEKGKLKCDNAVLDKFNITKSLFL